MKDPDTKVLLKAVLIIPIFLGIVIFLFYQDSKILRVPIRYAEWESNVKTLKEELMQIPLPPETEIDNFEDRSKRGKTISLEIGYKTQIPGDQFVAYIKNELIKNGWTYYGKDRERDSDKYSFCRGKREAVLYDRDSFRIFENQADHYQLHFNSSFNSREDISEICK